MKNVCIFLRKHAADAINSKNKNIAVARKRTKFTSRSNKMLHLQKNIHTQSC